MSARQAKQEKSPALILFILNALCVQSDDIAMTLQAEDLEVDEVIEQSNLEMSTGGGGHCIDELGTVDDNQQMMGEHLGLAQEQIDEGIEVNQTVMVYQ